MNRSATPGRQLDEQPGVSAHPEGRRRPLAGHAGEGTSAFLSSAPSPPGGVAAQASGAHAPPDTLAALRAVRVSSHPRPQGEETGRKRLPLPEAPEVCAGAGVQGSREDKAPGRCL